jgi:hypothetical protein
MVFEPKYASHKNKINIIVDIQENRKKDVSFGTFHDFEDRLKKLLNTDVAVYARSNTDKALLKRIDETAIALSPANSLIITSLLLNERKEVEQKTPVTLATVSVEVDNSYKFEKNGFGLHAKTRNGLGSHKRKEHLDVATSVDVNLARAQETSKRFKMLTHS